MTTKLYQVGQSPVTVAEPQGPLLKVRRRIVGQERALDGTMNTLYVAGKSSWNLTWLGLASADFSTLWTELIREVDMTFQPPDEGGTTYTVTVVGDPEVDVSGFGHYTVRAHLEEV